MTESEFDSPIKKIHGGSLLTRGESMEENFIL